MNQTGDSYADAVRAETQYTLAHGTDQEQERRDGYAPREWNEPEGRKAGRNMEQDTHETTVETRPPATARHSPAPWTAGAGSDPVGTLPRERFDALTGKLASEHLITFVVSGRKSIGYVAYARSPDAGLREYAVSDVGEYHANVALVLAAPALLAALELVAQEIDEGVGPLSVAAEDAVSDALRAARCAEGGAA